MKKIIVWLCAVLLIAGSLAGCGTAPAHSGDKLRIVATVYPAYDWVREVLGEEAQNAEITLLADNGVDLHSFQPTAQDMISIASCNMFLYVGGESDEWVEDALEDAANPNMSVIKLFGALGNAVKKEEIVEGMQVEKDNDDDDDDGIFDDDFFEKDEEDEDESDEHVWLSLRNAQIFVDAIAATLGKIDPEKSEAYRQNADAYNKKLAELDLRYQQMVGAAEQHTLLFADRFPFRYLVDDYDLSYYAAFVGCSAESEASFETVTFLAKKVDELGLKSVMVVENSDRKIADTVISATKTRDQSILELNSLQSVTDKNGADTYLSVMEKNLSVLEAALK